MWTSETLLESIEAAVTKAARRVEAEQSWRGVDAFDELEWHAEMASAFRAAGFGAHRETLYPGQRQRQAAKARLPRERERCDLAITERAGLQIGDGEEAGRRAEREAGGGLFNAVAQARAEAETKALADHADVCWLEFKVVGQFAYRDGTPGPNAKYASELVAALRDVTKLARDPGIVHGWLCVLLFARDEATARHDLHAAAQAAIGKGTPVVDTHVRAWPIPDRIGNGVASAGLYRAAVMA